MYNVASFLRGPFMSSSSDLYNLQRKIWKELFHYFRETNSKPLGIADFVYFAVQEEELSLDLMES